MKPAAANAAERALQEVLSSRRREAAEAMRSAECGMRNEAAADARRSSSASFALTPTPSFGENVTKPNNFTPLSLRSYRNLRGLRHEGLWIRQALARFSLSPRERARVRGNLAELNSAVEPSPDASAQSRAGCQPARASGNWGRLAACPALLRAAAITFCFLLVASIAFAQRRGGRAWWGESNVAEDVRTAREVESHSTGTPEWKNPVGFEQDVFTFTRVRYLHGGRGGRGGWSTDIPDSDLNLSYRLQQMTALRVDPDGRVLELGDDALFNYPWLYIVEPGALYLTDAEVKRLRDYLLNGGFLMFDDFWGERDWDNLAEVMKQVFPERDFVELPLDHPLYHCVFDIRAKGQVPNVGLGVESEWNGGVTWERPDAQEVHHRVIFDDAGRIMVFAAHNTDNGDGWEREGESDFYFHNFSEKISYPLGINLIFYVMTH
jgi:hypothetical protein